MDIKSESCKPARKPGLTKFVKNKRLDFVSWNIGRRFFLSDVLLSSAQLLTLMSVDLLRNQQRWKDELWIIQRSETARTCHKNC